MAHSAHTIRIVVASIIALFMVGGAYALSGPLPFWNIVEAQSAEELLREYAVLDSDFDGLPDWQESLYGTDPFNPESFQAGIRDGDAVAQGLIQPKMVVRPGEEPVDIDSIPGVIAAPASLTDRFSQLLLTQYLQNRGTTPPTKEEIAGFVTNGVQALAESGAVEDAYGPEDVRSTPDSGTPALQQYATNAGLALSSSMRPIEKGELSYFQDLIRGDTKAAKNIREIADMYANAGKALMNTPVPQEAQQAHLTIANALALTAKTTTDLASFEKDPLQALIALGLYDRGTDSLSEGFLSLDRIFTIRGILPVSDGAAYIISATQTAAQNQ